MHSNVNDESKETISQLQQEKKTPPVPLSGLANLAIKFLPELSIPTISHIKTEIRIGFWFNNPGLGCPNLVNSSG